VTENGGSGPESSLRRGPLTGWIAAGAVAGGLLAGTFRLEPALAWGMGYGLAGGALGALAGWVWRLPKLLAVRLTGVVLILAIGLFVLWLIAGRAFLLGQVDRALRR
jgi:hypothetical protein